MTTEFEQLEPNGIGEIEMEGVREYGDGSPVALVTNALSGRVCVRAYNEGCHNWTEVDVVDLVSWLRWYRPDILEQSTNTWRNDLEKRP